MAIPPQRIILVQLILQLVQARRQHNVILLALVESFGGFSNRLYYTHSTVVNCLQVLEWDNVQWYNSRKKEIMSSGGHFPIVCPQCTLEVGWGDIGGPKINFAGRCSLDTDNARQM